MFVLWNVYCAVGTIAKFSTIDIELKINDLIFFFGKISQKKGFNNCNTVKKNLVESWHYKYEIKCRI